MTKRWIPIVALALAGLATWATVSACNTQALARTPPRAQVALLLDTSNSMDGLIGQAKTKLWQVVNEIAKARKDGKAPAIEIALYEYGNMGIPADGWVRQVVPFTTDLDLVSEKLFALTTNGGAEFCGQALRDALHGLAWADHEPGALRLVFIAGNEPFTQGPVDYRPVSIEAKSRGIVVNAIHCGSREDGIAGQWLDGAVLGGGSYFAIDANLRVVEGPAPQDEELARLGAALNSTYLPYGALGMEGQVRQTAQDANALQNGAGSLSARNQWKASSNYRNESWDLVDAVRDGKASIEKMRDEDLPQALQRLSIAERKARVAAMEAERARLQARIQQLSLERERFLAARRTRGAGGAQTLDTALLEAIHAQGAARGFRFP